MPLIKVIVPATSANLGPGFDCLGLALGLYNEFLFSEGEQLAITVAGEAAELVPCDASNLVVQAAQELANRCGRTLPPLRIHQTNHVPAASGMGSSSTAVIAGLLGANALLETGLSYYDILEIATAMEGHPDNVAPALFGGLVLVPMGSRPLHVEQIPIRPLSAVLTLPAFELLTSTARAALPSHVARAEAIFNLARTPLVIRALEQGDYVKLGVAMQDKIHQPYRIPLVPGMAEAFTAAHHAGASAVAISGAGPSIIAFAPQNHEAIGRAAVAAFAQAGLASRYWILPLDTGGSLVSRTG
jgi:homoserine kinase